jgi:Tol biopolymer transport system component/DNA-binding winged helix-turn-helix (wHTH) protein
MMGPDDDVVYEFGPFRLCVGDRLLSRDGTAVPLEPTQFQVLTELVREAGHLVTREHLMSVVWKGTYVDEGSLTVTISLLRRKLGDTPSQPRYIETVRKSGYRFAAAVTRRSRHGGEPKTAQSPLLARLLSLTTARWPTRGRRLSILSTAALIAVITGWYWSRSEVISEVKRAPVLLHPFGGLQEDASFSPDGEQVAFTWRPPESTNYDIYVLKIGDLQATRLTSHPAWDMSPSWSPDGRRIAFIRSQGSSGEILLMSPAGGPEQKVVETVGTSVTWSADSQTLAFIDRAAGEDVHSIFLVPAAGGPKRRVTFPTAEKTYGDAAPAISPDGRTLAFVRRLTYDVADVFVQPLDTGKPRRLTFDKRQIRGLAWMPNGQELIFSSNRNGRHELWRLNVSGTAQPTLVEGIADARFPTVSSARFRSHSRLVYQTFNQDHNIRLLRRGDDGAWNQSATFAASIRDEQSPRLSPDRRHLSFVSDRSGWFELWVCAYPQASECLQLTSFRQGYVGSPAWSPDSQRIAFDARVDGNADIYVVRVDGGQPVRLTDDVAVETRPSWSRDGRWIYFRSDRTGTHQIWKMPVSGGATRQVTRNGGYDAHETTDGKSLYYVQGRYTRGLWSVPVDGGPEVKVQGFESLTSSNWTITDAGILWIDLTASNPPSVIRFYDSVTRNVSMVANIPRYVIVEASGFDAAPDGSIVMWSQLDRHIQDLMLLERFR